MPLFASRRRYRDLVRAGSADFRDEIVELICDRQRAAARLSAWVLADLDSLRRQLS